VKTREETRAVDSSSCDVSIVIPNWNGGEVLITCIDSILDHTLGVELELIVVDNGSTDESRNAIAAFAMRDGRVRPVYNDRNLFFATACNQGFERSRGRYVLIANNDILLTDDSVTDLVRYADSHPDVSVVTPRFVGIDGEPQEFVRRLPNAVYIFTHYHRVGRAVDRLLFGRHFQDRYFYRDRTFADVEEIEQAGASFSLFRRDAIERLDCLFDEEFPLLFNDVDLYTRLKTHGAVSLVLPHVRVVHLGGVSSSKFDASRYRRHQDLGMFRYFKKHHPIQYRLLVLAWPRRWLGTLRRHDTMATW